jgi:hypothetical protein
MEKLFTLQRKCAILFIAVLLRLQNSCAGSPVDAQHARGMISYIQWGTLVTASSRTEGVQKGDAFGNTNSIADVNGVPYIYGSDMDASFVDIDARPDMNVSFALSEASLVNDDGSANITDCKIGYSEYSDPENPPCARLVLTGTVSKPAVNSSEDIQAKKALFSRHPSFKNMPSDHGFFVAKININGIWLIDAYGGGKSLTLSEYFAAIPIHPSVFHGAHRAKSLSPQLYKKIIENPPLPFSKAKTARWMVTFLDYGFLCTISTRSVGTSVGTAFGNPYSFADVDGVPYIYASQMDASIIDLFTGNTNVTANSRGSLSLSEASYSTKIMSECKIGGFLGDPENPLCARLVLTGNFSKVISNSSEAVAAQKALFSRHPSFSNYPVSHEFFIAKLNIDGIWLVDIFGGAAIIQPEDYFHA